MDEIDHHTTKSS